MTSGKHDNPYESPQCRASEEPASTRRPGGLAVAGMVFMSIITAGFGFFATCTGVYDFTKSLDTSMWIGLAAVPIIGAIAMWAQYRLTVMTMNSEERQRRREQD